MEAWSGHRVEVRSPLFVDIRAEERAYELGKVQNLRTAVRRLNGVEVPEGALFSFWRQIGRATKRRSFANGRMLQSGCVVPSTGGGLCQLSNAMYQLALETGCEIVERHAHSVRLDRMPVHDATVAWNYIDLRFRPRARVRMEWHLTGTELVGAFVCESSRAPKTRATFPVIAEPRSTGSALPIETCGTCGKVDCSRHEAPNLPGHGEVHAFLVDAFWPEFDLYLQCTKQKNDWLMMPIDGARWKLARYAWTCGGFAAAKAQPAQTLIRSFRMRRIGPQGARRQTAILRSSADMARSMAAKLPAIVDHLVVDQTLLPELWKSGVLGGRTFDVLMHRLPMRVLQARLDDVAQRWPESQTAADFRAGSELLDLEDEALYRASRIITAHSELARLFGTRVVHLDWAVPGPSTLRKQGQSTEKPRLYFPGPVTARKGAFLLRAALEGLDVELVWRGPELEGSNFWGTVTNRHINDTDESFAAVIQPAYLEDRPRLLLEAMAAGIPVISTEACGIPHTDGIEVIRTGDFKALRSALQEMIGQRRHSFSTSC